MYSIIQFVSVHYRKINLPSIVFFCYALENFGDGSKSFFFGQMEYVSPIGHSQYKGSLTCSCFLSENTQ
jgi:hypothetical protein